MVILWILFWIIVVLLSFYKFIFLRDPIRAIPSGKNVVSPADGKVMYIGKYSSDKLKVRKGIGKIHTLTKDVSTSGYVVSIFMNIFNCHVNRSPLDGSIISVKHKPGKFLAAWDIECALVNESSEIVMKTSIGKIKVIQIAGFVARGIETFVKRGSKIKKGMRLGRIVLGSQVTMILPKKIALSVKVGDKVKAGSSIIGSIK